MPTSLRQICLLCSKTLGLGLGLGLGAREGCGNAYFKKGVLHDKYIRVVHIYIYICITIFIRLCIRK